MCLLSFIHPAKTAAFLSSSSGESKYSFFSSLLLAVLAILSLYLGLFRKTGNTFLSTNDAKLAGGVAECMNFTYGVWLNVD